MIIHVLMYAEYRKSIKSVSVFIYLSIDNFIFIPSTFTKADVLVSSFFVSPTILFSSIYLYTLVTALWVFFLK